MATKKRTTGRRSRTTKTAKENIADQSAPHGKSIATEHSALDAPRLDRALDLSDVHVKGPEAGKATVALRSESIESRAGGQAGSLQGLSDVPEAASESVYELLEEGNAFEASITIGVQDADRANQGEVKTREVPEDDVPEEYQNPDQ